MTSETDNKVEADKVPLTKQMARAQADLYTEMKDRAEAADQRCERLAAENAELTRALTGLTCGGSEFFVRKGERYVADIPACVEYVRRVRTDAYDGRVREIRARKADKAKLSALVEATKKAQSYMATEDWPAAYRVELTTALLDQALASLDRTAPGETPKVCVLCGAPNANPRPWDPREPVCPDCQDGEKHAAAPAQEVAGLVTFPREPTREMWAALGNALAGRTTIHHDAVAKEVWAGLCALSSSPSQGGETL